MSTRERPIDRGHRLATADRIRIGNELRVARQIVGESVHAVGAAAGMSGVHVSRVERGLVPTVSIDQLARLGAAIGLDIRVRAYPGARGVLDAGQVALLGRLRARLPEHVSFRTEVPLPIAGDQRAWDATIGQLVGSAELLPVEAETRLVDAKPSSAGRASSSGIVVWNTSSSCSPIPDATATYSRAWHRCYSPTFRSLLGERWQRSRRVTIRVGRRSSSFE
jgi:transcriptional regulator with XRE-family HTH domain